MKRTYELPNGSTIDYIIPKHEETTACKDGHCVYCEEPFGPAIYHCGGCGLANCGFCMQTSRIRG